MKKNSYDQDGPTDIADAYEEDDDYPTFTLEEIDLNAHPSDASIFIESRTISSLEQVIAYANAKGRVLGIEDSTIDKARILTAEFPIGIDDSVFIGNLDCHNAQFNQDIKFWDVYFSASIDFHAAVFHGLVLFEDCQFERSVDFSATVFENNASFVSCDFEKETSFAGAQFKGKADFQSSVFKKSAVFKNTVFSGALNLDTVTFESGYDTTGSNLEDVNKAAQDKQEKATKRQWRGPVKAMKQKEFNPWAAMDRASKKKMSRRDLFRGIRNLIPKRDDS